MNLHEAYSLCIKKFEQHKKNFTVLGSYEGPVLNGEYYKEGIFRDFYDKDQWMASFITGFAPLYYRTEKDNNYLIWANQFASGYKEKVFEYPLDTMHDLGFLYQPYSVAMYQLTGDINHKISAIKAADELLKRFNIYGRYIDAWRRMDDDESTGRAIVDSMMNIPLLFWAWKETGHTAYRDIAKAHADTIAKYFVREDYSVAHSFLFDTKTGELLEESNTCGFGNGSHWGRGTAWAAYGFAMTAKYLDDKKYYDLSMKIVEKYLKELGADNYIPVWDFRLPADKPAHKYYNTVKDWDETDPKNKEFAVDTSATAIMACAIFELDDYIFCPELRAFAEKSLEALCDEKYIYFDTNISGILKRQNGRMNTEPYGDYYFAEALQRALNPHIKTCWH